MNSDDTQTRDRYEDRPESSDPSPSEASEPQEATPEFETASDRSPERGTRDRLSKLRQQERELKDEIATLQASKAKILQEQSRMQADMGRLVQSALSELEQRKQNLHIAIEQLERRQERIQHEMRTTFAGASQDLAIRVQGFKDYLTGSLQDLAAAAEELELTPSEPTRSPVPAPEPSVPESPPTAEPTPQFAQQGFQDRAKQIRQILDRYRNLPDYYGPPWQLRRTFEPIHAQRLSHWFFSQGGRGALKSMGSRLQNILIASTAISVLRQLYGDRVRTLVLANSPERLGEWRRGLQDCLGVARRDFGPDRGLVLFEAPEPLAQKADRLLQDDCLPFIVIDESEGKISLSMLQFPLWLAFAPDPETSLSI